MGQDRGERRGPSRRQAMAMLGAGAAAAALPAVAQPAFPPGSVIRTILKDYKPEELAGGATLFHEHMSLRAGFMVDWTKYAADSREANRIPGAPPPAPRPAGAAPPAAPAGPPPNPDFMLDEAVMVEEM